MVQQIELQKGYMALIKEIINGKIKPDSIASLDSVQLKEKAHKMLEKSENEKKFIEKFEAEEKYNLASIDSKPNENMYVFFRPTRGVISSSFNLSEGQYGIYLITSPNESVLSVLAGTVVYAAFTFDYGWVIQVQHENNYLSIYKNNTRVLKKVGDEVKAGESIAITGDATGKKAGSQFYFELWKQGKPIDPEEVIIF
jgi:murein DD-endopeptidase MepM/ murein hydrolase activator NlpD